MQSCSGQIFYLPVSIECILFPSVFLCPTPSFDEMTERVINRWKPPVATRPHPLALTSTHTHTLTHLRMRKLKFIIHVSCERGPISMTRAGRINLKNCHFSAIVGAPWFRRTLRSRAWLGKEKYGSVGMLRGVMEECFNDHLEDQSISLVKVCWRAWGRGTWRYDIAVTSEKYQVTNS